MLHLDKSYQNNIRFIGNAENLEVVMPKPVKVQQQLFYEIRTFVELLQR